MEIDFENHIKLFAQLQLQLFLQSAELAFQKNFPYLYKIVASKSRKLIKFYLFRHIETIDLNKLSKLSELFTKRDEFDDILNCRA